MDNGHYGQGGKEMKQRKLWMPLDLQFFAEPAPTEPTQGAEPSAEPVTEPSQTPSFDDLLKDKAYQSEFDKRMAKGLETAKAKWQAEQAKAIEDAKTEAEKLAKMNAEQKTQYELDKKQKELDDKLKAISLRELRTEAQSQLVEMGISKDYADFINYDSAETVKASIDKLVAIRKADLEKAVNDKLGSQESPKKGTGQTVSTAEEAYKQFLDNPNAETWDKYQKLLNK